MSERRRTWRPERPLREELRHSYRPRDLYEAAWAQEAPTARVQPLREDDGREGARS